MTFLNAWFDPLTADAEQILERAKRLKGKTIRSLMPGSGAFKEGLASDKGRVGQYIERIFGLARNNEQAPDFRDAGIELKAVPMRRSDSRFRSKERTNVTMIHYMHLPSEQWGTATVKKKLEKILFVFYEHLDDVDPLDLTILDSVLWTPEISLVPDLKRDWSVVKAKVMAGQAHLISEGDGKVLGAATKGAGGGKLVQQPNNPGQGAKPRAWALKPALTTWIFADARRRPSDPVVSIHDAMGLKPVGDFEVSVLDELHRYTGRRLGDIAKAFSVPASKAKSNTAIIVRRAIGVSDDKARIREFEQRGIEVKTVPLSLEGVPYEAMSFPAFRYKQLIKEEWEDSDLLGRLQRLLIVPLIRPKRRTPRDDALWGRAFFWSPSVDDLRGIRKEWSWYVRLIAEGHAKSLPGYSKTEYIHMRPKGRDSDDTDDAPIVGPVVKKAFWLNPAFIARIVAQHGGLKGVPGATA